MLTVSDCVNGAQTLKRDYPFAQAKPYLGYSVHLQAPRLKGKIKLYCPEKNKQDSDGLWKQ